MRDPNYVTLLQLCNDVLRRPWTVATTVVLCAAGAAGLSVARPRTYTSETSFVGEARQALPSGASGSDLPLERMMGRASGGGLSGGSLGGSLGASLPGSLGALSRGGPRRSSRGSTIGLSSGPTSGHSSGFSRDTRLSGVGSPSMRLPTPAPAQSLDPAFYETALRSREVLMAIAASRFPMATPAGVRMGTAADFFRLPSGPTPDRTEDAARRLARQLEVMYSEKTGVLTVSVRTTDSLFSHAVASRLLEVLMERNRRMADSRAEAQVAFLTRATAEARGEATVAQNRLAAFLRSNRAYVPASPLAMTFRRLERDVVEKRQQYTDLSLQLERAKLDRSRATQLITVVSRPEVPSGPDARGMLRTTLAGAVGGGALAVLLVLTSAQVRRLRAAGSDDLAVLESEWRAARRRASRRRGSVLATTAPSGAQGT